MSNRQQNLIAGLESMKASGRRGTHAAANQPTERIAATPPVALTECTKCKGHVPADSRFCNHCGTRMVSPEEQEKIRNDFRRALGYQTRQELISIANEVMSVLDIERGLTPAEVSKRLSERNARGFLWGKVETRVQTKSDGDTFNKGFVVRAEGPEDGYGYFRYEDKSLSETEVFVKVAEILSSLADATLIVRAGAGKGVTFWRVVEKNG